MTLPLTAMAKRAREYQADVYHGYEPDDPEVKKWIDRIARADSFWDGIRTERFSISEFIDDPYAQYRVFPISECIALDDLWRELAWE